MPKLLSTPTPKQDAYDAYLNSAAWQRLRLRVLERDGNHCTRCGKAESLQVHHLTYARIFCEPLDDLVTLCAACHSWTHKATRIKHTRPSRRANKKRRKKQLDYMTFRTKVEGFKGKSRAVEAENQALHERQVRARERRERRKEML